MNVLVSVNTKFLKYLKVMLKSLYENNMEKHNVYLLYSSLTENELLDLECFVGSLSESKLYAIRVDETQFKNLPPLRSQFSVEILYRVLAPFLLNEINKCIWIDADVVVNADIHEFYNQPMKGKSIAVVEDNIPKKNLIASKKRLGMKEQTTYFNSGIILFDLAQIRKSWTKEKVFKVIDSISDKIVWHDQDILNVMFEDDKCVCDRKWNYQVKHNSKEIDCEEPAIIHFVGIIKPWNIRYSHPLKWKFWKYYSKVYGKGIELFVDFATPFLYVWYKLRAEK